MDAIMISHYRMGVRLEQAHLAHQDAWGSGRSHIGEWDAESVKHTLARLGAAFELWARRVDAGDIRLQGDAVIKKAAKHWENLCQTEHLRGRRSLTGMHIKEVKTLCQEFVEGRRGQEPESAVWFQLGLEIVQLELAPVDHAGRPRHATRWEWRHPNRLQKLVSQVQVSLKQLIPDLHADDPVYDALPTCWLEMPRMTGWFNIEAGLNQLGTGRASSKKRRRCYDRDHQLHKWHKDKKSETYQSVAKVRNKWNELHPKNTMLYEAVKKAIARAQEEDAQK